MKSERRHELEKNELADWLAGVITTIKPYQNAILAVVLLVMVAGVSYSWWVRRSAARIAEGWDEFYQALAKGNPDAADFEDIVENKEYAGTDLAHWAGTMAGDLHLAFGCNALFVNKATADQELRDAIEHYTRVCQQSRNSTLLERATFGLARAREAQGKDLDAAIERYKEVSERWPDGAYAAAAKERLEDLQKPSTKAIYDRFAKFDPKPDFSDEPGEPGQRPAFDLDSLPDDGSLFQPKMMMDLEEKGADEESKPDDAADEEPKPDDAAGEEPKPDDSAKPPPTPE